MFWAVIGLIPRQFVNDSPIEASVGPQMKPRHRMVGIPTIRPMYELVAAGQQRVATPPTRRTDASAPPAWGPGGADDPEGIADPDMASGYVRQTSGGS